MCGRFTLRTLPAAWCQLFLPALGDDAAELGDLLAETDQKARYNIAPTQMVLAVRRPQAGAPGELTRLRWGLVPSWAKDLAIGNRMINARAETVDSKPSFRAAFRSRRCLIPADGYYEWQKQADGKQPYLIERNDGGILAMAGLWELNKQLGTDDKPVESCTIITTEASQQTSAIHDRMPVFLAEDECGRWLDPNYREVEVLKSMLDPAANGMLRVTAVSRHVNNPRNEDSACIEPVESAH